MVSAKKHKDDNASGSSEVAAAKALLLSSSFYGVYISEVHWLLATTTRRLDQAMKSLPALPDEGFIISALPEFHDDIDSALIAAARFRRMVSVPTSPSRGEKPREFAMRKARAELLREPIAAVDISEFNQTVVRDALEHLDEKLDAISTRLGPRGEQVNSTVLHNIILSHRSGLEIKGVADENRHVFRFFVQEDGIYEHGHGRLNVPRLQAQARAAFDVYDTLLRDKTKPADGDEARSGEMVFFNKKSKTK